jgi:hypothetical protein
MKRMIDVFERLKNGCFSIKSMYFALKAHAIKVPYVGFWMIKIPLRVKIFLWLAFMNSILSKDNLVRRGCIGDEKCRFCSCKEIVDHIFFPLCRC